MSLPKAFLEEIRVRVPLSDLIGQRMKLTRAGREFKGCCPFHKEKTPSFTVNDQKGFYHCFGCGASGDAIKFLIENDKLRFMEAVEQLASMAGLSVPKPTPEEQKKFQQQMSLYDLMETAAAYFEQQLYHPSHKKYLNYLVERGLSKETIKSFRLGFTAPNGDELKNLLIKKGYNLDDILEAGLYRKSERNKGEAYPFFRERIIFPVTDIQGRIIAFGGRILPSSHGGTSDKSAPKYINSPETAIFHKGRNLYGLSRARKPMGDGETVIVVEGYMDVIALAQAGFPAAVAPLGTALTEGQIEELWKAMPEESRNPVLCFDGDAAGQRAASRALERVMPILKPDQTVRFAFLPEKHDPDSLIKEEGRGAMERVIQNAVGVMDMLWREESGGRDLSQPETKAGFKSALKKRAMAIQDETVKEFFINDLDQRINALFLTNNLNKKLFTKQKPAPTSGAYAAYRPSSSAIRPVRATKFMRERILIAGMIFYPELFDELSEQFGLIKTESIDYDKLRQDLIGFLTREQDAKSEDVKYFLIENGHSKTLDAIFDPSLYIHAGFLKPGHSYDSVRQGWLDTYERGITKTRLA